MDEIINENGWKYYVENEKAFIIGKPEDKGDTLFIPEELGGYPVAELSFRSCSLYGYKAIHVSKNVRYFEGTCLNGSIASITVDEKNPYFTSKDGILYSKDLKTLVSHPPAKEYFDPACLKDVEVIADGAFIFSRNLISLVIPDSVKEIGDFAFADCLSLEHIEIPDSVSNIGAAVFSCSALKSIRLSKNIRVLDLSYSYDDEGDGFFAGTDLTGIALPEGVEEIGDQTFASCRHLNGVYIPASVKKIGEYVFFDCTSLKEIIVSEDNENYYSKDGVLYSADGTLIHYPADKNDEKFTVPDGIKEIGEYAFFKCKNVKKLTLPESVTKIGYRAFLHSRIEEMNIPKSVKEIGKDVFLHTAIRELYIPEAVEFIEMNSGTRRNINPYRGMLLTVRKGSYAERMCIKHKLRYTAIE